MIDLEPVLAHVGRAKNFRRQAANPALLKPFRNAEPIDFARVRSRVADFHFPVFPNLHQFEISSDRAGDWPKQIDEFRVGRHEPVVEKEGVIPGRLFFRAEIVEREVQLFDETPHRGVAGIDVFAAELR